MLAELIDEVISTLEQQELEAPNGIATLELYTELYAAYLCRNELSFARFLWKRIPASMRTGNAELEQMHKLFECIWHNRASQFYKHIDYSWSPKTLPLMEELKERFRQETEKLIGTAYSTIMASTCGEMLNSPEDKLTEVCERLGWVVEAGVPSVIIPKKPPIDNAAQTSCEEQMKKLTEFVSFLES